MSLLRQAADRGSLLTAHGLEPSGFLDGLSECVAATKEGVGRAIKVMATERGWKKHCPKDVFPLPLLPVVKPRRGRGRERAQKRGSFVKLSNVIISTLNTFYTGPGQAITSRVKPSLAQLRVHDVVLEAVRDFLRGNLVACGDGDIKRLLRYDMAYGLEPWVVALGEQAGVPSRAAVVDLAAAVGENYPSISDQILDPEKLLLDEEDRPKKLPKAFVNVDRTYDAYVQRNVVAGLQELVGEEQVYRHEGKLLVSGAFGVPKNEKENRAISAAMGINALLDRKKLPRPKFGYPPRMRTMRAVRGSVLLKSKRDARHYYHVLKPGDKWKKYLAHPPVWREGKKIFPLHRAVPMGFAPAAGWAQCLTDTVTEKAGLPIESKLRIDEQAPKTFPVWSSIVDDIWWIDELVPSGDGELHGPDWLNLTDKRWADVGV